MRPYDVVVVGVGGAGSAAAWHLARRGARVRAIERFEPGHSMGSSHGLSRIIRLAYYEDPSYVPLLRRAYELWRDLEDVSGESLLHITGAVDAGPPGSRVFEGSRQSCLVHALPHEVLSSAALSERCPGYRLPADYKAVLQPDGGYLEPERCVTTHVAMARASGAVVDTGVSVRDWRVVRGGVEVVLDDEAVVHARHLVLTAGAWLPRMSPALAAVLAPERQVVGWFAVADHPAFAPDVFPVFNLETNDGHYYGFPEAGEPGFKIGRYHHRLERVDPDTMDRMVHPPDESILRAGVARMFPAANGALLRAEACLFTNTPDEHFIIDRLPGADAVLAVSACSGHGFKFCSVLGEIVADLVLEGRTAHDCSRFRLDRFAT